MTAQEAFDRFCRHNGLGHREDIENYPDVPAAPVYAHTREIAEELIASALAEHPTLLPIHFDFVRDPSVNAVAFRVGGTYFIGLTSGAMLMLHLVLQRMLASPNTFPNVGNPAAEDPNITPVPWQVANAERLWNQGVRPVPVRDRQRLIYSHHLADQVLMFLVGHEIAHITRGHVDFLNAAHGSSFIRELG